MTGLAQPDGQPRRALDTSPAAALFGFRAQTDFRERLRRTIHWYEAALPNAARRRTR
jgi:nucleoside-diphosphate-sugar epimerase